MVMHVQLERVNVLIDQTLINHRGAVDLAMSASQPSWSLLSHAPAASAKLRAPVLSLDRAIAFCALFK